VGEDALIRRQTTSSRRHLQPTRYLTLFLHTRVKLTSSWAHNSRFQTGFVFKLETNRLPTPFLDGAGSFCFGAAKQRLAAPKQVRGRESGQPVNNDSTNESKPRNIIQTEKQRPFRPKEWA
jgi:hypothetical protein